MRNARVLAVATSLILLCVPAMPQVATGTYPFGSFVGGPDAVNLGNLNANWTIPIINKAGRGTNFVYNLTYDSSVWYPAGVNGSAGWQPVSNTNWGWQGLSPAYGGTTSYSMSTSSGRCGQYGQNSWQSWTFSKIVYEDASGSHYFPTAGGSYINSPGGLGCPPGGGNPPGNTKASAMDGSGLTAWFTVDPGYMTIYIVTKSGLTIYPGASSGIVSTDTNGNQISVSSAVYTDTLGKTALTVVAAGSNVTLSYPNPSGNSTYTVSYTPYNIKTNFGCSGISEYSANGVGLVNTITLPDGTYYQFAYEPTPGYSGYVTGRPASVRLPTGGTISYAYTGGNNGIVCSDGTAAGLTRTTPDGTWTYARNLNSSSQWTTTVTAPSYSGVQDQTVSTFLTNAAGLPVSDGPSFYEIERQLYAGSASSGTLLETVLTCYEARGVFCSPGDTGTTVSALTRVQGTTQWPSGPGISSGYIDTYDSYGNNTSHAVYDYAAGANAGNLLQTTTTTYTTNYGADLPSEVTVTDGQNPVNTLSDTLFGYSTSVVATSGTPQHQSGHNLGNLSSVQKWVSGSTPQTATYQTASYTYFDTGNVQTATDFNGTNVTTYTYNSTGCANSFLTGTSTPVKNPAGTVTATLTSSAAWNCSGGVVTSSTDANNNTTTYNYGNDKFWRPVTVTDPALNVTTAVYSTGPTGNPPENISTTALSFNGTSSVNNTATTTDGLGRTWIQQKQQGPSSSYYDSTATSYDSRGRVACQSSVPYSAGKGVYTTPGPGNGNCTTYDALGRKLQRTDAGGGTVTYTYNLNDVLVAKKPAPTGENFKQRSLQYNGAGQLASVCEITSVLSGNGPCGQNTAQNGYLTLYTYDGPNLTKVQQNAQNTTGTQTRSLTYDALGRRLSETIPEWSAGTGAAGTSTYTYDSSSSCSGSSAGDLIKSVDNAGNVTCNTYDSLHRRLSATVVSGPYAPVTPVMNYVYDAATYNGTTAMQNAQGNLAEAFTGSSSSKITDLYFSKAYGGSAGGIVSQVWEWTNHSGGYFLTTDAYYPNGALGLRTTSYGVPSVSYGLDGEGRPNAATDTTHPLNLVTAAGTTYNTASAATGVSYGNGDSDAFGYDAMNRPNSIVFNVAGGSPFSITNSLTWNANSSLQQMQVVDTNDSTKSQNCNYSADDLSRIAKVDCGSSTWVQTFTYDAFGNINKTGNPGTSYSAAYSPVTNQVSGGPSYDANGNQLTSTPATLTWNALNLPISVNSTTATYDALGRMVEKGSGGTYTQFVFSPAGTLLAEYSGGLVKGTIPLPGGGTAIYNGSGLNYIRHTDWLGSSRLATTWAHAVYSKEAYAPFGETYNEAGTPDRSFTGQDQDVVTGSGGKGVYDFLFRKYDPSAGRWLSPDPAGWSAVNGADPQSLNRYAYVENQPMSNTDPQGEWMCFSGSGVSTGLEVDPGMTCWSDGYGYSVEADSAGKFTFDDNGTITATISGTLNGQDYSYPLLAGYWTQIEGIPGITNGQRIFSFNGSGSSSSSGAPNNGPTWSQKNKTCLNTINNTPDGKFYNFFSPLSMIPGIGPDWQGSIAEDVGGGTAKFVAFKFFQGAGANWAGTGLGVIGKTVSGAIEGVAEGVLAPVAAAATVGQLTVHAGCAISAAF